MKKISNQIPLIILLALLSAIAPMSIDTYIPAIPQMANSFDIGIEQIELTLSIFLIGFAIGQIFGGAYSDVVGRKKSSIVGLSGFAVFSGLIIFANSVYMLWIFRFFEAFFGGLIVVNGNAIARDIFHGNEAAKIFSLIGAVRSLAPLIAPFIGSFILYFYSWEFVFVFLTAYSFCIALYMQFNFKETYTYVKQDFVSSYMSVLKNKKAMKIMISLGFGFSGMFTIIEKSSFIYMEYFGVSKVMFPFYFSINVLSIMALIKVNIVMLKRYSPEELIKYAMFLQIIIGMIFTYFQNEINLFFTIALFASYTGLLAFIFGNATALSLEYFPTNAGVASSVLGVVQFGLGALLSGMVLLFHSHSLLPVGISITLMSLCAFLIMKSYKK